MSSKMITEMRFVKTYQSGFCKRFTC